MNFRLDAPYGTPIVKPRDTVVMFSEPSELMWNGVPVTLSEFAMQRNEAFDILCAPRRRRGRYSVRKRVWYSPGAYYLGRRLVIHPDLWKQLLETR